MKKSIEKFLKRNIQKHAKDFADSWLVHLSFGHDIDDDVAADMIFNICEDEIRRSRISGLEDTLMAEDLWDMIAVEIQEFPEICCIYG